MLNKLFTDYFGFNKQQRNGLVVLLCISLLLLIIRLTYPLFLSSDPIIIKNLPQVREKVDSGYRATTPAYASNKERPAAMLFNFDPNKVSYEDLVKLGFREKAAAGFIKYRSKGFVFRQKSDLKKIYGVSEDLYRTLEPFIVIETFIQNTPTKVLGQQVAYQDSQQIELNSADSITLLTLPGIGPGYAKRILNYRRSLGGFHSIEQLKEVYGLTETFDKIKSRITVDNSVIQKINLNTADFKSVNKHPYISYDLTKTIFDWRRKTTLTSTNIEEIVSDQATLSRLRPYLAFD